jgi:hypothetical protein
MNDWNYGKYCKTLFNCLILLNFRVNGALVTDTQQFVSHLSTGSSYQIRASPRKSTTSLDRSQHKKFRAALLSSWFREKSACCTPSSSGLVRRVAIATAKSKKVSVNQIKNEHDLEPKSMVVLHGCDFKFLLRHPEIMWKNYYNRPYDIRSQFVTEFSPHKMIGAVSILLHIF